MSEPVVAVVMLNYNGKKLLQQYLPAVLQHSAGAHIYVADNASTDDSLAFVSKHYPSVRCIPLMKNTGFAGGYNEALKQVQADYYVLLNSDVEVTPGWLEPVIAVMEHDRDVAACQPKLRAFLAKNTFEYAGACGGFIDKYGYPFCRGRIFNELEQDSGQYDDAREVFWATGACMFVRASVYHELGGFDDAYFAHMEEIDLCWRMKNTGRKVMVVPASVVYHLGGGTLNKLSPRKTFLNFRNNLVTLTKNYPNNFWLDVLLLRLILDGIAGLKFLLEGKPLHTLAVLRAHFAFYFRLPAVLRSRRQLRAHKQFKASYTGIYNGNIVREFYLNKVRRFSALNPVRFSA